MIREVKESDAKEIIDIYNHYILNSAITFETEEITLEEMSERIKKKTIDNPWIVYEEDKILGYAYVSEFNFRDAYSRTREVTIYVDKDARGKGIGKKLMKELIADCKERNFHLLVSIITVPNESSERLHEMFGFEKVGVLNESGFKMNKWQDVSYWQLKI